MPHKHTLIDARIANTWAGDGGLLVTIPAGVATYQTEPTDQPSETALTWTRDKQLANHEHHPAERAQWRISTSNVRPPTHASRTPGLNLRLAKGFLMFFFSF